MIIDVTVAGVRSPVLVHGPSDAAEGVVFVHGNPGPKEDWADVIARLPPHVRAIAPDMPGYGKADRPRGFAYTVDGYANHLGGVIDQLGIRRVHLVLHDFGGPWGLRWASRNLARVASLTLVNVGILPGYRWHKYARIWQTPILGEIFQLTATRAVLRSAMNRDNPKPFPPEFIDRVAAHSDWGMKRAVLKLYRASRDVERFVEEARAGVRGLDVPTCVVWGAADPFLPVRYAEQQKEFFPRAEVHRFEGCGHWPMVDEPARFASVVVPFLTRAVGAKPADVSYVS